ncbi:esterase [Roseburia sp. CAG:309]|nr:esterase [Roseburia sp. CAG:309]
MFTNKTKKRVAILLAGAIVLPGVVSESFVFAKAKCTVKKMTLEAGQKRTIKIKNKVKGAKYIFKSSKPLVAKVNAKGMVTAKKAGKAVITVVEKRKTKKKTKKKTIGRVKVMVKNVKDVTQSAEQSKEPVATAAVATEAAATVTPSGGMVSTATPATVVTASATPSETPSETPMATPLETAASKPKSFVDDRFEVPGEFDKEVKDYEYADPQTITYYSKVSEAKRKAVVYVPKDYDAAKEYPILYLLHGIGGDENEWKQGNPEVITGNLTREGKLPETIVVCPNQLVQVPGEKMPGNYLDPGRFVMFNRMIKELNTSLIPYMEEHYSIKEGRDNHAIAGLSMGGRTSLYCGFNMLDYFSYIGAFEPAPGVLPYSAEEGLFTEDTFKIPEEYQDTTLIMIQQGDKDNVVSDNPTKYHKALDKNGVPHLFNNVPYGHDWTAWKEGLYNFARRIFQ